MSSVSSKIPVPSQILQPIIPVTIPTVSSTNSITTAPVPVPVAAAVAVPTAATLTVAAIPTASANPIVPLTQIVPLLPYQQQGQQRQQGQGKIVPFISSQNQQNQQNKFYSTSNGGDEDNTIDDDPNAYFVATFNDGYIFRNLIDYLKGTSDVAYFTFSKKKITYLQSDKGNNWINDVEINAPDLEEYEFSSIYPKIVVGFQLDRLREAMKIGKKDGIRIYKKPQDNHIYIQDLSSSSGNNQNMDYILSIPLDNIQTYSDYKHERDEDLPNVVVVAAKLSHDFGQLKEIKNKTCVFRGYKAGMALSLDGEAGSGKFKRYGYINDAPTIVASTLPQMIDSRIVVPKNQAKLIIKNPDEIVTIVVLMTLIKLLIKLKNLAGNSTVRFFFEEGKAMKIRCKIGYFGVMRIYVKSLVG